MATIQEVKQMEVELARKRKVIAAGLAAERKTRALSLRHVAQRVSLTASSLLHIERGNQWETKTIARIIKFYERSAA